MVRKYLFSEQQMQLEKIRQSLLPGILSIIFQHYQLAEHMTPMATVLENFTISEYFMDVMAANLSSLSRC